MSRQLEVCLSPVLVPHYQMSNRIVVVIDIFRASSSICFGIDNGATAIIPVATVDECLSHAGKGFLLAAERNGEVVAGFDFGNSPYAFMNPDLVGKTVVLTTTNGTNAIEVAKEKSTVVIGCLNNLTYLSKWLIEQNKNVLVLASGWKEKMNLEDTICAGAIADILLESRKFVSNEDSTISAKFLYRSARDNFYSFLRASSHRKRLMKLKIQKDVKYFLTLDTVPCIPILRDGKLVKLQIDNA